MKFIARHKVLFYFLQFTWGVLMNLIGFLIFLFLIIVGKKPHYFQNCFYIIIGNEWGGVSFGCFFFTDSDDYLPTKKHETGHALQNTILGPLFPFLVAIPSVIRYWYRELHYYRHHKEPPTEYDSIWFEGQATLWGNTKY